MDRQLLSHAPYKGAQTITKTLLIMKVAIFLLLVATTSVDAKTFSQGVTISGNKIS